MKSTVYYNLTVVFAFENIKIIAAINLRVLVNSSIISVRCFSETNLDRNAKHMYNHHNNTCLLFCQAQHCLFSTTCTVLIVPQIHFCVTIFITYGIFCSFEQLWSAPRSFYDIQFMVSNQFLTILCYSACTTHYL